MITTGVPERIQITIETSMGESKYQREMELMVRVNGRVNSCRRIVCNSFFRSEFETMLDYMKREIQELILKD